MISRVVILGGTGYLGRVIGRHAEAAGLEVDSWGSKQGDLCKPETLASLRADDHTAVVLAAAITRDVRDDDASMQLNLDMARNVAAFAQRRKPGHLVYLSSVSVYGRSKTDLGITEQTPVDLDSRYAKAKHGGEEILAESGVPLTVLRGCQVYGPTDTHVTYGPSRFIDGIRREGKLSLFGEGDERRDFLFEDDFGAVVQRLTSARATGTYNLATGQSRSFMDLAEALKRIVPSPFELVKAPRKVAKVDQGFKIDLLRSRLPGLRFTPLEEGLRKSWEGGSVRGKG